MFLKKIDNGLNREIEKKELIIKELKKENQEMEEIIKNFEDKKPYKNYDYVIFVKKGEFPKYSFWNKGRFEKDIVELHFNHRVGETPSIEIVK